MIKDQQKNENGCVSLILNNFLNEQMLTSQLLGINLTLKQFNKEAK